MFLRYNRKRIRASNKHLLFYFMSISLSLLFILVMVLFYFNDLTDINSNSINKNNFNTSIPYLLLSTSTAITVCVGISYLYYKKMQLSIKQMIHRQKLARMILENGWYETKETTSNSFFKDLNNSKTKSKISYFPKIYYKMKDGIIYIRVEILLGKYQEQLLNLEKKLETGLYCELFSKELKDSFVEYTLLYDTISQRIPIDDVYVENGSLKLMDSVSWEYDNLPHMLLAGGTGGGKTYFILTLIKALSETNTNLYILDPKNSDLADLSVVLQNVYYRKDDMINCLNLFYENMMQRNEQMKQMDGYKTGKNYAYLNLPANFLIFDEYVAFMDSIGREAQEVMTKLKQIVMLGRQSGFFLILACQRPDAKYLGDGIRDQFNMRIALGRMSDLGYNMMFGENDKSFFLKQIKGRGYIDNGTSVISEFYTPLVPKGYDFIEELKKIHESKLDAIASCETKDAEADETL